MRYVLTCMLSSILLSAPESSSSSQLRSLALGGCGLASLRRGRWLLLLLVPFSMAVDTFLLLLLLPSFEDGSALIGTATPSPFLSSSQLPFSEVSALLLSPSKVCDEGGGEGQEEATVVVTLLSAWEIWNGIRQDSILGLANSCAIKSLS